MVVQVPTFPLAGFVAAVVTRSLRAGVHTTVWAALASGVFTYPAWLPTAQKVYETTSSMLLDGDEGIAVESNLGDAMFWAFVLIPVLAIPLGVIAAAAGAWLRRKMAE